MKPVPTRQLKKALLRKGFQLDETHHTMFWLIVDGKKTSIKTRLSHGKKEYGSSLLSLMSRQLRLSKRQFEQFVACPLTQRDYIAHLRREEHVKP